jgi:hypothetical protein
LDSTLYIDERWADDAEHFGHCDDERREALEKGFFGYYIAVALGGNARRGTGIFK